MALRYEWLDWEARRFALPPTSVKQLRWQYVPVPQVVIDHLRRIRTDRELIFPWPVSMKQFDYQWHRLLKLAGIPRKDHFGLHDIRKTVATRLWGIAPEAATLALGHAAADVTLKHYVFTPGIVQAAMDKLSLPEVFKGNGSTAT